MAELLIGCGNNRKKRVHRKEDSDEWKDLVTLDIDPGTNPDYVHDLNVLPYPFEDNQFDEIHAYEVLEHCGQQGDWHFFFAQFYEFWRILKPDGVLFGTTPMWDGRWAWGDPGHTRIVSKESFVFLNQGSYEQVGKTSMTDYRPWWKGNFELAYAHEDEDQLGFGLVARK